jgi:ABC-type branched-chain amino acid transport systems, periplasmic component
VSAQAEASGVPCVLTICPWEQWYYKSSGAANTFQYSYMYFLGTQEETSLFTSVWAKAPVGHVVGGLWPADVDGAGFEKYMKAKLGPMGWKVVPSGGYTDGTSDFASIISTFKAANVDILHAVPIPPDFITFWRQAHQNGFTPKIASISKALLFPSAAAALGPLVNNVMSPLWWTPQFPYILPGRDHRVGLRGQLQDQDRKRLDPADGVQLRRLRDRGRRAQGLRRPHGQGRGGQRDRQAEGPGHHRGLRLHQRPVPHVSQIPELLAQWRVQSGGPQLVVIDNSELPAVPVASKLQLL